MERQRSQVSHIMLCVMVRPVELIVFNTVTSLLHSGPESQGRQQR